MDYLKKLYDDCNEVVRALVNEQPHMGGGINWAHLRCVSAESVTEYWGDPETTESHRVVIEEASPEAVELQKAVYLGLIEKGHVGIQVATEW